MRLRQPDSIEAAAAELERAAGLGHRGAILDVFSVDTGDPAWDRLWSAAEQTDLPISFHIKGGSWSGLSYRLGKWQSAAFATIMPLQFDEALATMVFCGALERHPGCKVVLAESGIGWLPYFLARMDLEADIDPLAVIDVEDRPPAPGKFRKGLVNQVGRPLRPWVEIGPGQRRVQSELQQ